MTVKENTLYNGTPNNAQITVILLISGFIGFCVGIFGYPMWQTAVEPAQIIAGLVQYPQQNPNYIYQAKLWTILHQISAIFLYFGISEKTVSLFISGFIGMVSYQAIALWVFALSGYYLLAILSSFAVHFMLNNGMLMGVTYPLMLMGFTHTYGMIGLSFILLTAALIGAGQYKAGGLLLGISPAIHPSLGLWLNIIVFICLLWDFRYMGNALKQAVYYIFSGYLISAISLTFHIYMTYDIPNTVSNSEYFYALIRHWDNHRQPFSLYSGNIFLIVASLILSLSCLLNKDMPRSSLFFFHSFIVSALFGGIFSTAYWLPPEKVPAIFFTLMPSRLLNYNVLISAALLIGLLGYYRDKFWVQFNLTVFVVVVLFNPLSDYQFIMLFIGLSCLLFPWLIDYSEKQQRTVFISEGIFLILWGILVFSTKTTYPVFFERYSLIGLITGTSFVVSGAFILLLSLSSGAIRLFKKLFMWFSRIGSQKILLEKMMWLRTLRMSTLILFGVIGILTISTAYSKGKERKDVFQDWTNDPLFAEASKGEGMLLTCSNMRLVQLRTRRPVLLDGGSIDGLAYTPAAGQEMNRILKQVYGIDFLNPPEEIKMEHSGALSRETGKVLWETRSIEQWSEIKREFGITNILCYSDWKLQLPEVIRNNGFVLYSIKDEGK